MHRETRQHATQQTILGARRGPGVRCRAGGGPDDFRLGRAQRGPARSLGHHQHHRDTTSAHQPWRPRVGNGARRRHDHAHRVRPFCRARERRRLVRCDRRWHLGDHERRQRHLHGQFANFQSEVGFIDNIDEGTKANGVSVLKIAFSDGSTGVLTVGCHGPGAPPGIFEGIATTKGYKTYYAVQPPSPGVDANRTLFHVG
jgi:hypothetical protein